MIKLWQAVAPKLGKGGDSIMTAAYPRAGDLDTSGFAGAEADIEWLKAMVSALRRIRSELGVSPARQVTLLVRGGGDADTGEAGRPDPEGSRP